MNLCVYVASSVFLMMHFASKFDLKNMVSSFDLYMEEMALTFIKLQGRKSKQQNFSFWILQFEFSYLLYMKILYSWLWTAIKKGLYSRIKDFHIS
jgi:hypothetical protein